MKTLYLLCFFAVTLCNIYPQTSLLNYGNCIRVVFPTESGDQVFITNEGFSTGANSYKVFHKRFFDNTLYCKKN